MTKNNILVLCLFILILFGIFATGITIEKSKQGEINIPVKIEKVHDGDTITITATITASVRLQDCWAAELKTDEGKRSAAFLKDLAEGKTGKLLIPLGDKLDDSFTFGRVIGKITLDGDTKDLSAIMVEKGYATPKKVNK